MSNEKVEQLKNQLVREKHKGWYSNCGNVCFLISHDKTWSWDITNTAVFQKPGTLGEFYKALKQSIPNDKFKTLNEAKATAVMCLEMFEAEIDLSSLRRYHQTSFIITLLDKQVEIARYRRAWELHAYYTNNTLTGLDGCFLDAKTLSWRKLDWLSDDNIEYQKFNRFKTLDKALEGFLNAPNLPLTCAG